MSLDSPWSHAINSLEALTIPLTPGGHWLIFSVKDTKKTESFRETKTNTRNTNSLHINTWWLLVSLYVGQFHKLWPHPPGSFPGCTSHKCTGSCHWVGHCPPRWLENLAPPPDSRCPAIYCQCHLSALSLERAHTQINSHNTWVTCLNAASQSPTQLSWGCLV